MSGRRPIRLRYQRRTEVISAMASDVRSHHTSLPDFSPGFFMFAHLHAAAGLIEVGPCDAGDLVEPACR